jgi:hypothetical protein
MLTTSVFKKKDDFFRQNLAKIAENSVDNMDPWIQKEPPVRGEAKTNPCLALTPRIMISERRPFPLSRFTALAGMTFNRATVDVHREIEPFKNVSMRLEQGCQSSLDTIYQNGGKYTKLPLTYQMAMIHKYQIAVIFSNDT